MTKFRFRHLLNEKSWRCGREIPLADVASETGIPSTELDRLYADSNYRPASEVLAKMAAYFKCAIVDLEDPTTEFVFDLKSAFPPDDDFATDLICLLSAANDVTFLQGLYLQLSSKTDTGAKERSEKIFAFYLAVGFLHEGMKVFRRINKGHERLSLILLERMDNEGKSAYEMLTKDFDGICTLRNIRNDVSFHYIRSRYSKAMRSIQQEQGHFLVGLTPAETRFHIADDIRSEIFRKHVNFDNLDECERNKLESIMNAMGLFIRFAHGLLVAYLDYRKVEYKETTITEQPR